MLGRSKTCSDKGVLSYLPLKSFTVKLVVSGQSKRKPKCRLKVLQNALLEHSAILSTFIKQPFVIKTFILSIFKCWLMTGIAPDKAAYCVFTQLLGAKNAIKLISVRTKTQ